MLPAPEIPLLLFPLKGNRGEGCRSICSAVCYARWPPFVGGHLGIWLFPIFITFILFMTLRLDITDVRISRAFFFPPIIENCKERGNVCCRYVRAGGQKWEERVNSLYRQECPDPDAALSPYCRPGCMCHEFVHSCACFSPDCKYFWEFKGCLEQLRLSQCSLKHLEHLIDCTGSDGVH